MNLRDIMLQSFIEKVSGDKRMEAGRAIMDRLNKYMRAGYSSHTAPTIHKSKLVDDVTRGISHTFGKKRSIKQMIDARSRRIEGYNSPTSRALRRAEAYYRDVEKSRDSRLAAY